jgi:type II secretory pathway component PulM
MDTCFSEFQSTQGAASSANLSQHDHAKVVDTKSCAASSDVERLAAGISMMEIQIKRLSGAQWRTLTRARKMREGTWTGKKTPGTSTVPQDRNVVGSSGGM